MSDLEEAWAELRAALRAGAEDVPLRPEPGFDTVLTAAVGIMGVLVGVWDGLGVWAIPYGVVLVIVWLVLRAVLLLLMRRP